MIYNYIYIYTTLCSHIGSSRLSQVTKLSFTIGMASAWHLGIMPPPGVDYVTWSLKRSREAPAPGALTQEKQRAVDALSPRSKRAYRLGPMYGFPPFDPRLGSCPYDFPMYGDDYLNSVKGQQELKENAAASSKRRRVSPVRITGAATGAPRSDPVSIIGCMPEGQTTLDAVEATMTEIVKDMERTRPMCVQILEDPSLRIWIPARKQDNFVFQHIVYVVRALLSWRPSLMFKVVSRLICFSMHVRFEA